jgi:outer membrane lipoprotein SlyB
MTEHRIIERETVTEHAVEPHGTVEKDLAIGVLHGDEEAGGAFLGGAAGAVAGAIVGGPVGAVVGGAIGAAAGATGGAVDQKAKDDKVVVTRVVERP